jgi:predicted metal-dependent HD superfamily phosphohydrolase
MMFVKQQRFYHLLARLSAALSTNASLIWDDLQKAYQQPHRKYHTFQHINESLQLFDHYHHLAEQPLAVEFALWFHDTVYQPQESDNEQQSAIWATNILKQGQVSTILTQQIYDLIMATAHQQPAKTNDEKLLVDIDLAILAASPTRFAEYQQQIRAEYAWVAEAVYQQKRGEILTRLYNDGNIYHHPEIKAALETAARINLQQACQEI